jgi:GT2 family glycosyltransferase
MLDKLYTVIVNWNLKDDTIACIRSLLTAGFELEKILVVDNGSTDGSISAINHEFGTDIPTLGLASNLGYASGLNAGIEWAIQRGAEWCFLLNNDTLVAEDFLSKLSAAVCAVRQPAIITPMIYYDQDPQRIWSAGDRLLPGTLLTRAFAKNELDHGQFPALIPVDFVSGCAMLINRTVFQQIGYFPTNQFMYGEEIEFCWRARQKNIPCVIAAHAQIWHKVSKSSPLSNSMNQYWRIYNQIRFYRNFAKTSQIPFLVAFTFVRSLLIGFLATIRGKKDTKSAISAWKDGWFHPIHDLSSELR